MDSIQIDGKAHEFIQKSGSPLSFPINDMVLLLGDPRRCSAPGGPSEIWKLDSGKLWLSRLAACGSEVALADVYASGEPKLASWFTGILEIPMGEVLCTNVWLAAGVRKQHVLLVIERGLLVSTEVKDGSQSRLLPSAEKRSKLKITLEASADRVPCIDQKERARLRDLP